MSFINFPSPTPIFPVLPPLTWSVHKKPILSSRVAIAASGREVQHATAVYPRWSFILSYGGDSWLREQTQNILPDYTKQGLTELQQISSLFLACKGAYGEFYYDDPEDDSRLSAYLGQYSYFGSQTYPILVSWGYGPTNPSLTYPVGGINVITNVYVNGSVIPTANWALDSTRTQLYITGVANSGQVRADFTFYYRCRFLDDTLAFSQFAQNLWETKEVRFESVKP